MAKYYGAIGYAYHKETKPGVWKEIVEERNYRGDIILNQFRWQSDDKANENLNVDNSISIIADDFAYKHSSFIRYVVWYGQKWKVTSLSIKRPRLILQIGGVYNG